MITTKQINVNLSRGKLKLRHITTRDIDASIRVEPPKAPIKTKSITTTTLPDVADIAEKKRRDDIMAERKANGIYLVGETIKTDDEGFKKLNMQFVFVQIDDLVQAVSRRELKGKPRDTAMYASLRR